MLCAVSDTVLCHIPLCKIMSLSPTQMHCYLQHELRFKGFFLEAKYLSYSNGTPENGAAYPDMNRKFTEGSSYAMN